MHPKNTHHDGALGVKECHFLHYQTQGYRKITGSKCSGGVDLGPVVQPCPLNPNHKLVIVSLFAALVCISAATMWSFKRVLILVYLMTFNRYKPAASQDGNTSYSSELPLSQEEEQEYILGFSNSRGGHTSAQDVSRGKSKRLKAD